MNQSRKCAGRSISPATLGMLEALCIVAAHCNGEHALVHRLTALNRPLRFHEARGLSIDKVNRAARLVAGVLRAWVLLTPQQRQAAGTDLSRH